MTTTFITSFTYDLLIVDDLAGIRCHFCGRTSLNRGDVDHLYCAHCHLFHQHVAEARVERQNGATHDCGDWRTARAICAVCDVSIVPSPNDPSDAEIVAALVEDVVDKPPMELVLRPETAFTLAGLLQLALRHPDLSGAPRVVAERYLAGVRAYFADAPMVLEVLDRGDDPAEDR
jgi:hypothetical protein